LYYRLEIKQTYNNNNEKISFFPIISKIATYLDSNVLSRIRIKGEKQFFSFTVIAHSKANHIKLINYLKEYPLLSSKYLDFLS
jgi:hypothetical protein